VARTISTLRDHGVSLALDDLGVGHNALRRLPQLPVRRLKIDRSFVADLPSRGVGAHLVNAIIGLGERLGIAVIAEGSRHPSRRTPYGLWDAARRRASCSDAPLA
jgi:EAL domain-containing protein (putative c-di-GMP-specific phosphodiesterase class I)